MVTQFTTRFGPLILRLYKAASARPKAAAISESVGTMLVTPMLTVKEISILTSVSFD